MALIKRFYNRLSYMAGRDTDNRQFVSPGVATLTGYNTPVAVGGYSFDRITAICDCTFGTTIIETTTLRAFGFQTDGTQPNTPLAGAVVAAIEFLANGTYRVMEANVQKLAPVAYTASDIFELSIENTSTTAVLKYYRTPSATGVRAVVYTSTIAAATIATWFPLQMAVFFGTQAATLDQLTMTGTNLLQQTVAAVAPVPGRPRKCASAAGTATALPTYGQYF